MSSGPALNLSLFNESFVNSQLLGTSLPLQFNFLFIVLRSSLQTMSCQPPKSSTYCFTSTNQQISILVTSRLMSNPHLQSFLGFLQCTEFTIFPLTSGSLSLVLPLPESLFFPSFCLTNFYLYFTPGLTSHFLQQIPDQVKNHFYLFL